ncbi:MAG: hypothetical protein DI586_01060 [Micavibrio aeruginosavorus]|uniref:HTH cro/C1-type domain-containing protein n=1 Tax=Micavibrio aeruginosavorus TaxID=349221 RepID=A0A2W5FMN0_9BACT|nr:MAG: hypothetical protein DI586_01060 [Micavibrio aeruginosavorus]
MLYIMVIHIGEVYDSCAYVKTSEQKRGIEANSGTCRRGKMTCSSSPLIIFEGGLKMKNYYHYKDSGLDNVFLANGFSIDEDGTVFIKDIHGLHKAIGEELIFLTRKLRGKEIRYIRHYLDLSQKALGELLGVDYQTVLRWETGKNKITKASEKFLKIIFYGYLNKKEGMEEIINRLSDIDNRRSEEEISFTHKSSGWSKAA